MIEFTAAQIAEALKGEVVGNADVKLRDVAKIEEGREGALSFLANPKYIHYIYTTKSSAVLVNRDFKPEEPVQTTLIYVAQGQGCGHREVCRRRLRRRG